MKIMYTLDYWTSLGGALLRNVHPLRSEKSNVRQEFTTTSFFYFARNSGAKNHVRQVYIDNGKWSKQLSGKISSYFSLVC